MNSFNKFKLLIYFGILFPFLYTFNANFNLGTKFNIINFAIIILVFFLWLAFCYFGLVRDIFNFSETERNGFIILAACLAIICFYYNPFPKPESYFLDIPNYYYFIITVITAVLSILLSIGKKFFDVVLDVFIPLTIQSYLINIRGDDSYSNTIIWIIAALIVLTYIGTKLRRPKS